LKGVTLALFAVALLVTVFHWLASPVPAAKTPLPLQVESPHRLIRLTAFGELRALTSVTIRAPAKLPITFLVPEGTGVKAGELLLRFDASEYEDALHESRADLQVAQADLKKAEKELEAEHQQLLAHLKQLADEVRLTQLDLEAVQSKPLPSEREEARLELEMARTAFKHAKKKRTVLPDLVDKGFITLSTLEEAELEYLEAQADLQNKQFQFKKVTAGATAVELERVRIPLAQARYAYEKAQQSQTATLNALEAKIERERANVERAKQLITLATERLNRTALYAPWASSIVYAKTEGHESAEKVQLGMTPFEGQALLHLPDLSTMVVDTELNETTVGNVSLGAPVEVRLEAYPKLILHGTILQISDVADGQRSQTERSSGLKRHRVTVKFENEDPRLKPGLSATLNFEIDHPRLDVPK
jgi:multidrug resistance efflux pump